MTETDHPLTEYRTHLEDEHRYTETTVKCYLSAARNLRQHVGPGEFGLDKYKSWLRTMIQDGKEPSTVNKYHSYVKTYLTFIEADFDPDRAQGELPDYDPNALPEPLTKEQIRQMREVAETPEEEAIVVLLYHTGLRNIELRDLRWDDIDWRTGDLRVRRRKKRGWGRDTLPLYDDQLTVLDDWKSSRDDANPRVFPEKSGPQGIYTSEVKVIEEKPCKECECRHEIADALDLGCCPECECDLPKDPWGGCSGEHINNRVKELADRAGIERNVYPHLFRHSRATHMVEDGEELEFINQWLAHDSWDTTLRYARMTGKALRDRESSDSSSVFTDGGVGDE
jgi:integrase